jgi:hypothetical protein
LVLKHTLQTEEAMLKGFPTAFEIDPDIVTGYNIMGFFIHLQALISTHNQTNHLLIQTDERNRRPALPLGDNVLKYIHMREGY